MTLRGNLEVARDDDSEVTFEYDVLDRITASRSFGRGSLASLPDVTLQFDYDNNGNRTLLSTPNGDSQYQYDTLDRLTAIQNHKNELYTFNYDNASRLIEITRPGGSSSFLYTNTNLVESLLHQDSSSQTTSEFLYQYDNVGNRTQITRNGVNQVFSYDLNHFLETASNPLLSADFQNESFNYDSIGNRSSDQLASYTFDLKAQKLLNDGRFQYLYDNNGNVSGKTSLIDNSHQSFIYNSENQLIEVQFFADATSSNPAFKTAQYFYDALGRRIKKVVTDNSSLADPRKTFTRQYVYDGEEILFEYEGNGRLLAHYTHSTLRTDDVLAVDITSDGVNEALALTAGTYTFQKDALGSITDISDSSGNIVQRYRYTAYGVLDRIEDSSGNDITQTPIVGTSYTFTNREFDSETGLYYYRARYYDASTGRFLQRDPSPGDLENPITAINSATYVGNNPLKNIDPSGRIFFLAGLFAGIAGGAAGVAIGGLVGGLVGGGILGAILGAAAGALAGGFAGGLASGIVFAASGRSFSDGFKFGFGIGAISGAIAGAFAGFNAKPSPTQVVSKGVQCASLQLTGFLGTSILLFFGRSLDTPPKGDGLGGDFIHPNGVPPASPQLRPSPFRPRMNSTPFPSIRQRTAGACSGGPSPIG